MKTSSWVDSRTALSILKVRPQTLYANVSRRRIRAKRDPEDTRRSLYHAGDLSRLAAGLRGRPSRDRIAAGTTSWGAPLLASGISTVAGGRLWYRGQDAVLLSERASLEQVAGLLWECSGTPRSSHAARAARGGKRDVQGAIFSVLAARVASDVPILGRDPEWLKADAAELLAALSDSVIRAIHPATGARASSEPLHQRLARAWNHPASAERIRRALVLLADHELNASTFATRVAASTGAPISACVLAGFSTLSGPLHGSAGLNVRRLVDGATRATTGAAILGNLAANGLPPSFGHPLYPDGDIRAQALLESVRLPRLYAEIRDSAEAMTGERPNVDFALAAMTAAERLPEDAPLVIFALGRSVGWMAHALEQARVGSLIRPRASYSGPALNYGRDGRTPSATFAA